MRSFNTSFFVVMVACFAIGSIGLGVDLFIYGLEHFDLVSIASVLATGALAEDARRRINPSEVDPAPRR